MQGGDILSEMADKMGLSLGDFKAQMRGDDAASKEARQREIDIVRAVVAGPNGMRFLRWMAGKTVLVPPTQAELEERDPAALALMAARANGERQIFYTIVEVLMASDDEATGEGSDADADDGLLG